jgi:hypothetical protein
VWCRDWLLPLGPCMMSNSTHRLCGRWLFYRLVRLKRKAGLHHRARVAILPFVVLYQPAQPYNQQVRGTGGDISPAKACATVVQDQPQSDPEPNLLLPCRRPDLCIKPPAHFAADHYSLISIRSKLRSGKAPPL